MTPTKPRVLALLGDSILDNAAYTLSAPDTTAHVRALLGTGWIVECGAIDGATMSMVASQAESLRARHPAVFVLSVGGNDVLGRLGDLPPFAAPASKMIAVINAISEDFSARYANVLETLRPMTDRLIVCTIYDVHLLNADLARLAPLVLGVLNDRIVRAARRAGVEVLELRDVCTEASDFVQEIEPSAEGARKIAVAIARAVDGPPRVVTAGAR